MIAVFAPLMTVTGTVTALAFGDFGEWGGEDFLLRQQSAGALRGDTQRRHLVAGSFPPRYRSGGQSSVATAG